ncbi:hypothetical protein [Salinibaculum rarum]|uniref:hypothetical protein n=1 Tax=Salinibaculum rarum TaxID=3058903 RepID=UPI00265E36F8|nr:hypothetical protein [Salinibaculum sp. KK48]
MVSRRDFLRYGSCIAGVTTTAGCLGIVSETLVVNEKPPSNIESGATVSILGPELEKALKESLYESSVTSTNFRHGKFPSIWPFEGIRVDDDLYRLEKFVGGPEATYLRPEKINGKPQDGRVKQLTKYPEFEQQAIRTAIKRGEYTTVRSMDPDKQFDTSTIHTYVKHNESVYLLKWRVKHNLDSGFDEYFDAERAETVDGTVVDIRFIFEDVPWKTREYFMNKLHSVTGSEQYREFGGTPPKAKWVAEQSDYLASNGSAYEVQFTD